MADFSFEVLGAVDAGAGSSVLVVANPPAPVSYDASGFMACDIRFDSALALALATKTRRMTHTDQQTKRRGDNTFVNADTLSDRQWVFFSAGYLRRNR